MKLPLQKVEQVGNHWLLNSNEYAEKVLVAKAEAVPGLLALLAGLDEANYTQINTKVRLGVAAPPLAANHAARRRDKKQESKIHSRDYIRNTSKILRIFEVLLIPCTANTSISAE